MAAARFLVTAGATVSTGQRYIAGTWPTAPNNIYAPGDLALLLVNSSTNMVVTPAGWTFVGQSYVDSVGGNPAYLSAYYKIVASAQEANLSIDCGSTSNHTSTILIFRDVDTTSPIAAWQSTPRGSSNLVNFSSTPPLAGCVVVGAVGITDEGTAADYDTVSAWSSDGLTGLTEVVDAAYYSCGIAAVVGTAPAAATYTITATRDDWGKSAQLSIALKPGVSASVGPAPRFIPNNWAGYDATTLQSSGTLNFISWPSHMEGDLAILVVANQASTVNTPSGWTYHTEVKQGAANTVGSTGLFLYSRACTSSNMPAFSVTGTGHMMARIFIVRGAAGATPIAHTATKQFAGGSSTISFPPVIATTDECLVFAFVGTGTEAAVSDVSNKTGAWAGTGLYDAQDVEDYATTSYDIGIVAGVARKASAGVAQFNNIDLDDSGAHVALVFSIIPPTTTPAGPWVVAKGAFRGAPGGVTLAIPAQARPGDLAVAAVVSGVNAPSVPVGWTRQVLLTDDVGGGGSSTFSIYYRLLDGYNQSAVTITTSAGYVTGQVTVLRNVHPTNPINTHASTVGYILTSDGFFECPNATATAVNCGVLTFAMLGGGGLSRNRFGAGSSTTQTGVYEIHDETNGGTGAPTDGGFGGFGSFFGAQAASGAVDGLSVSNTELNVVCARVTLVVAPNPKLNPTLRGIGPMATAQTGATLTVPWPEHKSGDFAVLAVTQYSTGAPATPAGWTYITNGFATNSNLSPQYSSTTLFYRRAAGNSTPDPTFACTSYTTAQIVTYEGVATTGSPYESSMAGYQGGTSLAFPALSTTSARCTIFTAVGIPNIALDGRFTNYSASSQVPLYELQDIAYDNGFALYSGARSAAGSGDGVAVTAGEFRQYSYAEVALAPAGIELGAGITATTTSAGTLLQPTQPTPRLITTGPFYHSASNSVTVSADPTNAVTDDVLVLLVVSKGTAVATPSGWTFIRSETGLGSGPNANTLWAFWRRVTSAYTTGVPSVTVTDSSIASGIGGRMLILRDVDLAAPVDGSNSGWIWPDQYLNYVNTARVTVVTPNSLVLSLVGVGYETNSPDSDNMSAWASQGAASHVTTDVTEIFDSSVGSPDTQYALGMAAATGVAPSSGTYAIDGTADSNVAPMASMTIAFRPSVVNGPRFVAKGAFTKFIDQVNNVPWPAGHKTDDLGLMVVQADGRVQVPSGWTQVYSIVGVGCYTYLFYRWATSDAMPATTVYSWVVTPGVFNAIMCQVFAFRGVSKTAPFTAYATQWNASATTSAPCPNVTTPNGYNGVFSIVGIPTNQTDSSNFVSWTGGTPSTTQTNVRGLFDYSWFSGDGGGGFATWYAQQAVSGTIDGLDPVMDDADYYTGATVVLSAGSPPMSGAATAAVSASGSLSIPVLLATAIAAGVAITGAGLRLIDTFPVEVYANFGGNLGSAVASAAPLDTQLALAGSVPVTAASAGGLYVGTNWYASLAASAASAAALTSEIRFSALTATAPVTVVAPLATELQLAATIAVPAVTSSGALVTDIQFAGAVTTDVTGSARYLVDSSEYRAYALASAFVTGELTTAIEMAGGATAVTTCVAGLSAQITPAATVDVTASVATADLESALLLQAAGACECATVAALDTVVAAAASAAATANVTAALTSFKLFAASTTATASISPTSLSSFIGLGGRLSASATAAGAMAGWLTPGGVDAQNEAIVRVPAGGWLIHIPPATGVVPVPRRTDTILIS